MSTLQGPMNGILQSWTILTHLVMGSITGPMTSDERFAFDPNFDEFEITPKGQYKLSVFWMTHHPL